MGVLSAFALVLVFVIGVSVASQTILLAIWSGLVSVTAVILVVLPKVSSPTTRLPLFKYLLPCLSLLLPPQIMNRRLTRKEIIMGTRTTHTGSTGAISSAVARVDFGHHETVIPLQPRPRKHSSTGGHHHGQGQRPTLNSKQPSPASPALSEGHITSAGEETDTTSRKPSGGAGGAHSGTTILAPRVGPQQHSPVAQSRSHTRPNVVHNNLVAVSASGSQQQPNSQTQNSQSSATFVSASKCVV